MVKLGPGVAMGETVWLGELVSSEARGGAVLTALDIEVSGDTVCWVVVVDGEGVASSDVSTVGGEGTVVMGESVDVLTGLTVRAGDGVPIVEVGFGTGVGNIVVVV